MTMEGKLFEPVDTLRRVSDSELVRYRCFRVLPDNKYYVAGADRYRLPLSDEQKMALAEQSVRVFASVPFAAGSEARCILSRTYDTLDEAIIAFENAGA